MGDDVTLAQVRYAANFASNLEKIEAFWIENGFPEGYDRLLEELTNVVAPHLQRHPGMGRSFTSRPVDSVEAESLTIRIVSRMSALTGEVQLHEYVLEKYLVLYAYLRRGFDDVKVVQLFTIQHQDQLGYHALEAS